MAWAGILLLSTPTFAQQLVTNGGFETGSFSGWTKSGHSISVTTNAPYVHSGIYGAELGPDGPPGTLSQTLTTTPDQSYLLSLWLYCGDGGFNFFQVSWAGTVLFDQTNLPATDVWTNLQFTVTATSANTVLQFEFQDNPSFLGLDDVSVTPQTGAVFGWGDNFYGQIDPAPGLTNIVGIAAGDYSSLVLENNGTVFGTGANTFGPTANVIAIAAGGYGGDFALALQNNGTIVGWGYNGSGQTSPPPGLTNVVAIAAGGLHSLALQSNSTVVAWGDNSHGQTNIPPGLSNVVAIAAGIYHSMALKNNGTVVAWGSNVYGPTTNVPSGLSNVVAIAAGGFHSLALQSNGTVVAWGYDGQGQTDVPYGLSNVVAIAAGAYHSLALKNNGTLVGWGDDDHGEANSPLGLSNVIAIAAGDECSLALTYTPPTRPVNDDFKNAIEISDAPATVYGSNVNASWQHGESGGGYGPASVWWTWTPSQSGTYSVDTSRSSFDTWLSVYSGNSFSDLTLIDSEYDYITFNATAGTQYYFDVDGYNDGSGPAEGNITLSLDVDCILPSVTVFYTGQDTEADGIHVHFAASYSGNVSSCDNWQVLSPGDYTPIDEGCDSFEVVVSPTNEEPVVVTNTVSGPCGFSGGSGASGPTCSICLSRGTPDVLAGTTGAAAGPTISTLDCGNVSTNAQWYRMIPYSTGPVTVSTQGSSNATTLAVFDGPLTSLTNITCDNGLSDPNKISIVTFDATEGNVYWIAVDPRTNNAASKLRIASGFQPSVANYGMTNGAFSLQSSVALPITYQLLATTNLTINPSNWPVVLSTNLTTNYPYLNYQETNMKAFPQRFYLLQPLQ